MKKIKKITELSLKKSEGLRPSFFYMSKTGNLNFFQTPNFFLICSNFYLSLNYATFWRFSRKLQISKYWHSAKLMKTKLFFKECSLKRSNESAVLKHSKIEILFFFVNSCKINLNQKFRVFNRILTMCLYCAL